MNRVALLGLLLAAACPCVLACEPATATLDHPAGGRIARRFGLVENRISPKTRLHTGIDYEGEAAPQSGRQIMARLPKRRSRVLMETMSALITARDCKQPMRIC